MAPKILRSRPRRMEFTADEILDAVGEMRSRHGDSLTFHRFCRESGVPGCQVYRHFKSWYDVREAAGLPRKPACPRRVSEETLLEAFDQVARKLQRFPTPGQFERHAGKSYQLLWRRIGPWSLVRRRYREWLERKQMEEENEWQVRAEYGPVWNPQPQSQPERDVHWIRDKWRGLRVVFDLESRDFRERRKCECDLLIVLHHNWMQCPVPVLELATVMPELADSLKRP